ncbi:MAG: hypothetical protein KKE79_04320 [Actinobacteria bacterium]|nr:hypothetical protein [Actinomycetota bacterium]
MEDITRLFEDEGYLLEESLAADTWGELYRARYAPHDREVLFRRFPAGLGADTGAWELACAEIQAWARLDHPGILQVLDWGEAAAGPYLVTAMPGGTLLGDILAEEKGVETPDDMFRNLLVSVEAARQWGVLHLGLNLTCVWVAGDGTVEVGEFGLSYVSREFPAHGAADDLFLAPEQSRGQRVSAATDVYALGLFFIALSGGLAEARLAAQGNVVPEGLGELRPVLARCLDEQPLARYRSAGELAGAMGLDPEQWLYEEYRDCPLCRLKSEIERDATLGSKRRRAGLAAAAGELPYLWTAIMALAVVTFLVWWLALR